MTHALDDYEVDMIRDLYDEPFEPGKRFWTVARIAEKFELRVHYVRKIIACARRYRDPDQYG